MSAEIIDLSSFRKKNKAPASLKGLALIDATEEHRAGAKALGADDHMVDMLLNAARIMREQRDGA